MEALLRELLERMERIEAKQELILEKLSNSIIYPEMMQNKRAGKTKKEKEQEQIEEFKAILINAPRLREKFNLAMTPQGHRVLAYLKTGNPAAFDGLKRKI